MINSRWLRTLSVVCVFILITSCGDIAAIRESSWKLMEVNRNKANSSIQTTTYAGAASGARNSGFNTKFFNIGSSSTKVNVPLKVTVDIGNSLAAQKIRADKAVVYTYIRPRYELGIRDKRGNRNRDYKKERLLFLPSTSMCDGYYVILNPSNNYTRSWSFNKSIAIRKKTTGINMGIWGKNAGAEDWEAREISDSHTTKSSIQLKPFHKAMRRSSYTKTCYPDEATRTAWNR